MSCKLQRVDVSGADGADIAKAVVARLKEMRSDEKFKEFYKNVLKEGDELGRQY